MLVLTRRQNESIVIPEFGVKVTVLGWRDGKLRVGIECPREVRIYREEVFRRIEDEGRKEVRRRE